MTHLDLDTRARVMKQLLEEPVRWASKESIQMRARVLRARCLARGREDLADVIAGARNYI